MSFYTGQSFPRWQGHLFVGALKDQMLVRLELDGARVKHQEILLKNLIGRIRDVRTGPDGYLYLLTDSPDGQLLRLEPVS
jgi:glucose/arabinose dehydrogenase